MVIAIAQLMVVLDASIVNIALPSMQADLGISDADRQWVVTAYTLAFGSLLLLGGRIADYAGRKKVFIIGLLGFAGASALGGIAHVGRPALRRPRTAGHVRRAARAGGPVAHHRDVHRLQGARQGVRRLRRALRRWRGDRPGARRAAHPVRVVALDPARQRADRAARRRPWPSRTSATRAPAGDTRYDIPGAIAATVGLFCLVFGITKAETDGWNGQSTITFLSISVVLLFVFLFIEYRSSHPLLPLRIVLDRNRGGAYLASFFVGIGLMSMFLFISFFFQGVLQYSPLTSGLLFLPFSAGVIVSAGIASQLLPRFGPRWITADRLRHGRRSASRSTRA